MNLSKLIKNNLKNFLLVIAYIIISVAVYVVWFDSLWHLWYVDVITGVVIVALGIVIGYFYLKGEEDNKNKKIEAKEDKKEEVKEETTEEDNEVKEEA